MTDDNILPRHIPFPTPEQGIQPTRAKKLQQSSTRMAHAYAGNILGVSSTMFMFSGGNKPLPHQKRKFQIPIKETSSTTMFMFFHHYMISTSFLSQDQPTHARNIARMKPKTSLTR
jgi:hypothetical protein